jgi:hypothetical protein
MPTGTGSSLLGLSNKLISDAVGIYHQPALFNNRLLLALKGTTSEAELHVLRAPLNAAFVTRQLAANFAGARRSVSSGDFDGEIRFHLDEAVRTAIAAVFPHFAEISDRSEYPSSEARRAAASGRSWLYPAFAFVPA